MKEKKIAGAALDVFSKEPPAKDLPLFELDVVAHQIVGELRAVGLDVAVRVPHRGG